MAKVLLGLLLLVVGYISWTALIAESPELPQLDPDEWWGPKELKGKQNNSIRPFKIQFSDEMIKDLKSRIKNHRQFVPPLEGVGFEYGFNSKAIDGWLKYWTEEYSFKKREDFLNQYPQYKTNIQGLDIHFIRVKPQVPSDVEVVPLLLMHGWPGSVREFYESIPLLTRPTTGYNFAFEVIVPSLPGYGFSDAPVRPGVTPIQIAVIFKNLMNRLGHKKFYIQGGDWGSAVASALATLYPANVLGHHTNFAMVQNKKATFKLLLGTIFPSLVVESQLADRMYPLSAVFSGLLLESGYMHLQATKPDTVGVSLTDSPSGLLAYILEKFSTWTRPEHRSKADGGLGFRFSKEQLIDNLMIYWTTNSITTSMRLYAESVGAKDLNEYTTPVPTWALQAKNELMYQPPSILKTKYTNLLGTTTLEDGGHFIAMELPQLFADDVFKAVKVFREWHRGPKNTEL